MKILSTGQPSTLGNYLELAIAVFGEESGGVEFLRDKIKKQGENEEVLADEGQMLYLIANMPPLAQQEAK